VGVALTRRVAFQQLHLDPSQSSVPPALTPIETFQRIGTVFLVLTSEPIEFLVCLADFLFRWIYAQFIAVDANFKLKLKNRRIEDPELGSGWSYFVENSQYTRHVARNPHERDVRVSHMLIRLV